jgi:predicted alpha/beta superfamily hydrolase
MITPLPLPLPTPDFPGTLHRIAPFPAVHVPPRNVDFWLPAGYTPAKRYPVLYMHDGQNLFIPAESYTKITWGVAETLTALAMDCIVVGIWNAGGRRVPEYMPEAPFAGPQFDPLRAEIRKHSGALPCSDAYLRFLVDELKPWVDGNLSTLPDAAHTGVMGSSMGGLISLYAFCRHPQVFGRAGCLSTHFPIGGGQIEEWMRDNLPQPGSHRLYFDFGGRGIDRAYGIHHLRAKGFLDAAGWQENRDYLIRQFKSATHNEQAWARRLHIPMQFLFGDNL